MSRYFHREIKKSLANPVLQAALDANAERRTRVRQEAFVSLSGYQMVRQRARRIRAEVVSHLDNYLDQFIQNAENNGFIIHRAANGEEAVQIILEIAQKNSAQLIAKSKTMVSEEIHLNQALEKAGLRVVETDLGEYIVQLRGEPPAHIITPAVHLRRQEVGQTFHEKLGLPLTDNIPVMTAAAREQLRQVFLQCDIGLSGVNFGIAETGAICILTNEGNGRMVTTVPPVHIALMGIERLVPTFDDLAVMLSLLPRSATGQKLTVYSGLIHGPRKYGEVDGAIERHLVLLDNGRNRLRGGPLEEMLYCIRCGACLNACPVFRELGGHAYVGANGSSTPYTGPMGSVISPGLFGAANFAHLARASSLCGACKEACPVDIDLPKLLLRIRAGETGDNHKRNPLDRTTPQAVPFPLKAGLRFFTWFASRPGRFYLAQRSAGFFSRLLAPFSPWISLPALTGWGVNKDLPRPAVRPFHDLVKTQLPSQTGLKTPAIKFGKDLTRSRVEADTRPIKRNLAGEALLPVLSAELQALGAEIHICHFNELPAQILSLLHSRGIKDLFAWESQYLPEGILENLEASGIRVSHQPDPSIRAGLTGALAAAADTGTLVLPSGPGRPLTASLLPEIHLAVLDVQDIVTDLACVFDKKERDRWQEIRSAASVALVSGPSRTADIEMTLTIGVHGPKEVIVFCVQ